MLKLFYAVPVLVLLLLATLSFAKNVDLGVCYDQRDCDGFNGKSRAVKGNDSVLDHSLMDLPFCKSFLNVPEPNVKLSLCKGKTCKDDCEAASTYGQCYSIPEKAGPKERFTCVRRVTS